MVRIAWTAPNGIRINLFFFFLDDLEILILDSSMFGILECLGYHLNSQVGLEVTVLRL